MFLDYGDGYLTTFEEAFDHTAAWGPAKQIAAELAARGIDLSDSEAAEDKSQLIAFSQQPRYDRAVPSSPGRIRSFCARSSRAVSIGRGVCE